MWHLIFPNSWLRCQKAFPLLTLLLSSLAFHSLLFPLIIPSHHFTHTSFASSFPPFPNLVLHHQLHREHQLHYPRRLCKRVHVCLPFTQTCACVFPCVCVEAAQSGHWLFMTMLISCHFASVAQEVSKMTRELTYSLWLAPTGHTTTHTDTHTVCPTILLDIPRWCLHLSKYFPMMKCLNLNSFSRWNRVLL